MAHVHGPVSTICIVEWFTSQFGGSLSCMFGWVVRCMAGSVTVLVGGVLGGVSNV